MSFLSPKVSVPSNLTDATPGRTPTQSADEVLPFVDGRARLAVKWVTPVLKWKFRNTKTSSYAFFSCYGWIACGPVDEIGGLVVNSKSYQGIYALRDENPGDYYDFTIPKETPERYRFWWGLETHANYGAHLRGLCEPGHALKTKAHPSYKGIFALAVEDMEAGSATSGQTPALPNVEVVFYRRAPKAYSFGHHPQGTHLIAAAHDLLTAKRGGLGLSESLLNMTNWDAKIAQLQEQGVAGLTAEALYASPVFTTPRPAGDQVAEILSYIDGHIRERDGKLEVDYMPNDGTTANPAGLRVIGDHEMGAGVDPEIDPAGLEDLPTKVIVTGLDWPADPPLTEASEDANVPFARRLVGESRPPKQIKQQFWTTRHQIKAAAQLQAVIAATPDWHARVPVLRQYAFHADGVTPLLPGDRFDLDRPDLQLDMVVRIIERSDESDTHVVFRVMRERGAFPRPYEPELDPRISPDVQPPADLARYVMAEAPADLVTGDDRAVIPLVERSSTSALGYDVHFSPTNSWPGQEIGSGILRWAIGARLAGALGASYSDTTVIVDTVGADWDTFTSQSALQQADDQLLLYRGGEWFSVGTKTPLGGGSFELALKRARLGSIPVAHSVGQIVFVMSRVDLMLLRHASFAEIESGGSYNVGTATKWFKFRPYNQAVDGNITAAVSLTLTDPTPNAVSGLTAEIGTGKVVDLRWTPLAGAIVAKYQVERATGPGYGDAAVIGDADTSRFTDIRVTLGTSYRYRVRASSPDEQVGPWSAAVYATPVQPPLDMTAPAAAVAPVRIAGGGYLSDDGTAKSYATIQLGALPTGAAGQYLFYGITGGAGRLGAVSYSAAGEVKRLDDLTPGQGYWISALTFSKHGVPANSETIGASFTSATDSTIPANPTGFSFIAGNAASQDAPPPRFYNGARMLACTVKFTPSASRDARRVDFVDAFNLAGATLGLDGGAGVPVSAEADRAFIYKLGASYSGLKLYCRTWDWSWNVSSIIECGTLDSYLHYPSGDMGEQNKSNVTVSGLKTGDTSASAVRKVRCIYVGTATVTLSGGLDYEKANVSLANRGFVSAPDGGSVTVVGNNNLKAYVDTLDAATTSTNAVIFLKNPTGGAIPAGSYTLQFDIVEYD